MADTAERVSKLRDLRDSIDNMDAAIVHRLAERFRCTDAIGELKDQYGLPSRDPGREAEQDSRLRHLATVSKLDPDFAQKFLAFVIREVVRRHELIPRATAERASVVRQRASSARARISLEKTCHQRVKSEREG
jgi:chorismate mutase